MKYKVIATDFDGTLLSDDKKVSSYDENTLLQKKKEGTLVIGATARNINSIKSVLNINMFNYLIINNGTYVYDCDKSEGYYEAYISNDICKNMLEEENNGIDFCTKDIYYKYNVKDVKKVDFIKKIESFDEIEDKVLKINIYVEDQSKIESVLRSITSKYEVNGILMQDSNDDYKWISLTPKNINKKETLKKLLSKHNLSLNDVIYFGDSANDKELINESKIGVAMINAISSLKEIANDITDYDNNNSGVGSYLNK